MNTGPDGRERIARMWRADERECVPPLIAAAAMSITELERVSQCAQQLVHGMRQRSGGFGLDLLTRAFPLNSPSGLALLSLAEALLRVNDRGNAHRLLRDRLASIDWPTQPHAGWLPRALHLASWLLDSSNPLKFLAAPVVMGATRLSIQMLAAQFVFAQDIGEAMRRARRDANRRYRFSFDMLGEAAMTDVDAQRYLRAYEHAIESVGVASAGAGPDAGYGVSVKLSAIHPRYQYTQQTRAMQELLPRLQHLARLAGRHNIALTIDAEESERLELSLDLMECLMRDDGLAAWGGLGFVVQAYQKRAPAVIEHLLHLARRRPAQLQLRLVKGAYWDAEIKLAQTEGMSDYPVYTRKAHTDVAYLACVRQLLSSLGCVRPQFATHNAQTVAAILELADGAPAGTFEFQRLHGMGAGLYATLLETPALARPVRIYAPVGTRPTLLAYLMRRLLENGAAASFVQRAADPSLPLQRLIADPVSQARSGSGLPHPRISVPRDIFLPLRLNSRGVDLSDPVQRLPLIAALAQSGAQAIEIQPLIAGGWDVADGGSTAGRPIRNPADRGDLIGTVYDARDVDVHAAVSAAQVASLTWGRIAIQSRARTLEKAAELFERHLPELVALAIRESGKTLANGVGEVREAADYLRYYAAQIRVDFDVDTHRPLGVVACISPWNFPLAIFTGQVSAALAAGNAVLAKPAEQSSALAQRAVRLLHEAGVPRDVLQLLPGGENVGAWLVADAGVDGVVFTGSTSAARSIARTLAQRGDVPLIAETGGQNAMIVDSTALPEQVVADVVRSAFDSAGQRCSALRLLCLQQEIADQLLTMLEGAMRELRVGDPAILSTDVGPLIDEEARDRVQAHLQRMRAQIRCQSPMSDACAAGVFVAPTLIEIQSVSELTSEVFGPVLHVLRFDRQHLDELLVEINATGYGLTMGIASRVDATISTIVERANAGNLYVNRNLIGAVVGLQPFGGRGLSGTGPKAGGPLYLHRLLHRAPPVRLDADRSPSAAPALLRRLRDALVSSSDAGFSALRRQAERDGRRSLLGSKLTLQGYVGERNELRLRPCGVLRATGRSLQALIAQLSAALATGNGLIIDDEALAARLSRLLSPDLQAVIHARGSPYEAVLVDGGEARAQPTWLQTLLRDEAAHEGPITPVVVSDDHGYALERLLREQTLTVNTAAVGGDIRLLSLDDAGLPD